MKVVLGNLRGGGGEAGEASRCDNRTHSTCDASEYYLPPY